MNARYTLESMVRILRTMLVSVSAGMRRLLRACMSSPSDEPLLLKRSALMAPLPSSKNAASWRICVVAVAPNASGAILPLLLS
jgi:hypothetical protein